MAGLVQNEAVAFAFTPTQLLISLVLDIIQLDVKRKTVRFLDLVSNQYLRRRSLNLNRVDVGWQRHLYMLKTPLRKIYDISESTEHTYIYMYVYTCIDFFHFVLCQFVS